MEKFHERFGIGLGVEEAKRRFVNRVLNFVLGTVIREDSETDIYGEEGKVEPYLCTKLGERYAGVGCLERIIGDDLTKCLVALEALHAHRDWSTTTKSEIKNILTSAEVDIGIRWKNGQFLPAGAPVLDDSLVNDPLNLLNKPECRGVAAPFKKGLEHFLHSTKKPNLLADVLTDMYEALEALAKVVCQNEKDFSANREPFISNLGLADQYKRMLKEYIDYANKFGRHAGPQGKPKPSPSRKEVEAFIYLTGLFIRVALSKDS